MQCLEAVGVESLERQRISGTEPEGAVGVERAFSEIAGKCIDVCRMIIHRRRRWIDRYCVLDCVDRGAMVPAEVSDDQSRGRHGGSIVFRPRYGGPRVL